MCGVAGLWRHGHEPNLGRSHAEGNDVDRDRPAEQRQVRYRVGLRKIPYPQKFCIPQFNRLTEHFVQTEEDRNLDVHRQTAADGIDTVRFVKFHHLLVHPGWIVFVFLAQLLHLRRERSHLPHRAIGSILNRPEPKLNDGGKGKNGSRIISQRAVQQIHEVEQKLAYDFEYPEIHDLGFVVRKLRQAMIQFWPGIDFKARAVGLPGLQLKSGHAERPLNTEYFLVRRTLDIETPAPDRIGLGGKRCDQCRKKLVAHRNPFRARDIFLIKGSRGALSHAEKSATPTKPANVDALRLSSDAPDKARVIRVIPRVNRGGGAERNKVTGIYVQL